MNEQAIRFRFGIFVLASLILLAVLVILFGGFPNYFRRTESYTIELDNAQGVAPGTPVRRSGVRIGEVRSVELDNKTGKVNVGIRIDEKYFLRKGDRPTLVQSLLGGDSSIAFLPPEDPRLADPTPVEPGAVLQGVNPPDAGALMQKTAELIQPAKEAVIEIRNVFQGIDKLTPVVEATLKDFREIGKMARAVGPDLQSTSAEIRALAKVTRETIPEVKRTNEEMQQTFRTWGKVGERTDVLLKTNEDKIVKSIERMDDALKRINNVLSDENQKYLQDTLKNARNSSQQLEGLAKETSELIKDSRVTVKQMNNTLKRADEALSDLQRTMKPFGDKGPGMFKNFDDSADQLNKTLKEVRELIQIVARSDGTVQRLLSDPALYNNLNDSALMVTKILPRLDRVLRDVEIFSDKIARHPELLGVRGAIVPSIGLKESPSVIPYRVIP
jgi:phospholipid/cholesterol/gamma-HCH transport system substrate-binding protein